MARVDLIGVERVDGKRTTMPDASVRRAMDHAGVRMSRFEASMLAAQVQRTLAPFVERAAIAGSFRRGAADVGDLDYLIIPRPRLAAEMMSPPRDGGEWQRALLTMGARVLDRGPHRFLFATEDGRRVDVIATGSQMWGAALLYLTGSKWHNIALRARARERRLSLNEYGLWDADGRCVARETEESIYAALGFKWVPPKCRAGRPAPRWETREPFMARGL